MFVDGGWYCIGPRLDLAEQIEHVTSISPTKLFKFRASSIATNLSWATPRVTTRVEDQAFCLLSLFVINMPSHDCSLKLFDLRMTNQYLLGKVSAPDSTTGNKEPNKLSDGASYGIERPFLGSSPLCFEGLTEVDIFPFDAERPEYSMTNKGLSIDLRFYKDRESSNNKALIAPLNRSIGNRAKTIPMALILVPSGKGANSFKRMTCLSSLADYFNTTPAEEEGRRRVFVVHDGPHRNQLDPANKDFIAVYLPPLENNWRIASFIDTTPLMNCTSGPTLSLRASNGRGLSVPVSLPNMKFLSAEGR